MKTKLLGLFGLSILSLILFMSFASADINFVSTTNTQTVVQGTDATVSFTLVEDGTGDAATGITYNTPITLTSGSDTIVSDLTVTGAVGTLGIGATSTVMSLDFNIPLTQNRGTYTGTLAPTATYNSSLNPLTITLTIDNPFEVQACNLIGNPGKLNVREIDFNNLGGLIFQETGGDIYLEFGDDDEWFPLDNLEVEIEVENNGDRNVDVDDVEVEWGLYNIKSNEWVIDLDEEDEVNINEGDEEFIIAEFNLENELDVDLDDLDNGKHYKFYVIATGDVDNATSDRTCASGFEEVEIIIENDFVVLNDVRFPETVQCGADVQISAEVWNIGDDDQDEVYVEVHNNELGLFHKTIEIGDIDAFDDDAYNFNFKVPSDIEEKTYSLRFQVLDEDLDLYENDHDDDESEFTLPFRVSGGCAVEGAVEVSIVANLESGGKAGETLVVRATITNNGEELSTFRVNAAGFSQWASSFTVDRSNLVLGAGESADVVFTFDVNKDASGSQSFSIELTSEDNQVTRQPVSVVIEGRGGLFGVLTGAITSGNNAYLWGIGLLNLILVIIIIVVAVRVARR